MNTNNTPEADKAERMAYSGEYMVPTEVARKLESERDEAKRRCTRWLEEWHLTDRARCDMKSERDEARGAWYEMQSNFERSKTEVEKLIRERDEARKESEYYKERYEQLKEGGNERTPEIPKWYNGREIPADIKEAAK